MKGNEILVSSNPKGVFLEGTIDGAYKPGVQVQLKAATEPIGGRPVYTIYDKAASGDRGTPIILLADSLRGKTAEDAYVADERCFLYVPAPGEEMNVRVTAAGTGTGDAFAIGDLLMAEDGTGMFVPASSSDQEPFQVLETVDDVVAAGTLVHCMATGH